MPEEAWENNCEKWNLYYWVAYYTTFMLNGLLENCKRKKLMRRGTVDDAGILLVHSSLMVWAFGRWL